MKTLARVLLLLTTAAVLGLAANALHPKGIRLAGNWREPDEALYKSVAQPSDPIFAGLQRAAEATMDPGCVLVDASKPEEYLKGRIPGAVNLPFYDDFTKRMEALAPAFKDRKLIVYCEGPECESGLFLARALDSAGYPVELFFGGIARWKAAGLPVEAGEPKK